jgi:hypothetical protein
MSDEKITAEQAEDLEIARNMARAGIPIFVAYPCPPTCRTPGHGKQEYHLPLRWSQITPEESLDQIARWKPGMALGAVGGHVADFLDVDTQHDGEVTEKEIKERGGWPRVFAQALTPSGGHHDMISPLGQGRAESFVRPGSGIDYQGGREDGTGRAFVYLAPTVKKSKITGEPEAYRWVMPPDLDLLAEFAGSDDSGEHIRDLVIAHHSRSGLVKPSEAEVKPQVNSGEAASLAEVDDPFLTTSQLAFSPSATGGPREFTPGEAEAYLAGARQRLREAKIGGIEGAANDLAVQLSHFVPEFYSEADAYAMLLSDLGHTAYDPNHPAAQWEASKFQPVISGARVRDPWKAVRRQIVLTREAPPEPATADEVDALLAEMLSAREAADREPPEPLIEDFLYLDTEAWVIGAPGSKKSFVSLHAAACVAMGMPFFGHEVTQGTVVMIVAEGAGGMGKRLKAWEAHHGRELDGLRILPRPVQAADKHAWSVLVEACRRLGPVMVVVDTQARVTVGLEENSATDMGHYVEAVSAIRQATGACVLTIHHTGRQGGDARGSSAIDGAQYTELKVDVAPGAMTGMLVTEKQKDVEQAEPLPLGFRSVEVGVDKRGKVITSLVLCEPDPYAEAAEGLRMNEERVTDVIRDSDAEWLLAAAPNSFERRRLLQVLADIGQEEGLTLASAMQSVAERWYGGKISKAAGAPGVSASVLKRGWADFLKEGTGPDGEPLIVSAGGMRKRIHPGVRMS